MSRRFAAYAVCIDANRILLVLDEVPGVGEVWSLPGGGVEHCEDPFDAVAREFAEETGCDVVTDELLGVDSRTIPATESYSGHEHQNIGIFYAASIASGTPQPQLDDDVAACVWTPISEVAALRRSSVVEIGLALAQQRPSTGHVDSVPVGGLIKH